MSKGDKMTSEVATKLIYCSTGKCLAEIAPRGTIKASPVCFYGSGSGGNTCSEPESRFVYLPDILLKLYGGLKKRGWIR
jgi:hypothetical protein